MSVNVYKIEEALLLLCYIIVLSLHEIVYMFCFYCVTYVYCAVVISSRYLIYAN